MVLIYSKGVTHIFKIFTEAQNEHPPLAGVSETCTNCGVPLLTSCSAQVSQSEERLLSGPSGLTDWKSQHWGREGGEALPLKSRLCPQSLKQDQSLLRSGSLVNPAHSHSQVEDPLRVGHILEVSQEPSQLLCCRLRPGLRALAVEDLCRVSCIHTVT